jgi:hypothetical protein
MKNRKFNLRLVVSIGICLLISLCFFLFHKKTAVTKPVHAQSTYIEVELLPQRELSRPMLENEFMELYTLYNPPLTKSEWRLIYVLSANSEINPLLIVMKLQVEQSLVLGHNTNNLVARKNRACGFGSYAEYTTGTKRYYGFKTQVLSCINFFKKHGTSTDLKPFKTYDLDGKWVKPKNGITKALFVYCPKYDKYPNADGSVGTGNIIIPKIYNKFLNDLLAVRKKTPKSKKVLLTFDDSSKYVERIMETVGNKSLYAIFFLNGDISDKLLNESKKYGLDIGNHTKSHSSKFILMDKTNVQKEIVNQKTTIKLFRPPYLCLSSTVCDEVKNEGYQYLWGVGGDDATVESGLWSLAKQLNHSDVTTVVLHNNREHFEEINYILDFIGSISEFANKDDVTSMPDYMLNDNVTSQIQYFARPWHKIITVSSDLTLKDRPGGTYKNIGIIYAGQTIELILKFDWRWVDPKLEEGQHQWAMLKNGGWVWISALGDIK